MIPFPALGGALMDAHDEIEAVDTTRDAPPSWRVAVAGRTFDIEQEMAKVTGWSIERINHRGCQLWGELRADDRFTGGLVTLDSCICGEHSDCPDGWHYGDDLPCSCTADCAMEDEVAS